MKTKLLRKIRRRLVVGYNAGDNIWVVSYAGKDAQIYGATSERLSEALRQPVARNLPNVALWVDWDRRERMYSAKEFDRLHTNAMLPHLVNDYNKPF